MKNDNEVEHIRYTSFTPKDKRLSAKQGILLPVSGSFGLVHVSYKNISFIGNTAANIIVHTCNTMGIPINDQPM
jgi:hypothetical protein